MNVNNNVFKNVHAIYDIIGKKMIDLSYPIQNFGSSKEVAVVRMLSDNIQYKVTKPLGLKLVDDSENKY